MEGLKKENRYSSFDILKFVLLSLFGIFMFFVPVEYKGTSTIPLDHIVNAIRTIPNYTVVFGTAIVVLGLIYATVTKSWQGSMAKLIFYIIKLSSLIFVYFYLTGAGPAIVHEPGNLPLVWNNIMVAVTTIVPLGSVFLGFLTAFGLMEFTGVFMERIMRPLFRTPGRSAIDAVASFVGSYSLALIITNRVYQDKGYTNREAAIIATGFSTVSATFMIIVARTLDMMDYWLLYFFLTLIITFLVTAVTAYIWPLASKADAYHDGTPGVREKNPKVSLRRAIDEAMVVFKDSPSVLSVAWENFLDGMKMALTIAPLLLAIGTIGILVAETTPLFEWIGYIFYPFLALAQIPDPLLTAQAVATSIAEMLLPATFVTEAPLITRFLVAIVSVSEILFFSASIPVMMATDIKLSMKDFLVIWVERVILTILIAAPILHLIL